MLASLVAYYEQLQKSRPNMVAPMGWSSTRVSFVAHIDERGELLALVPISGRAMTCIVPAQKKRSSVSAAPGTPGAL